MSVRGILRRILLGFLLGGRSLFGISMSSEKIEELLYFSNQPRAEETISDGQQIDEKSTDSTKKDGVLFPRKLP